MILGSRALMLLLLRLLWKRPQASPFCQPSVLPGNRFFRTPAGMSAREDPEQDCALDDDYWHGHLVIRHLPSHVNAEYEQSCKPSWMSGIRLRNPAAAATAASVGEDAELKLPSIDHIVRHSSIVGHMQHRARFVKAEGNRGGEFSNSIPSQTEADTTSKSIQPDKETSTVLFDIYLYPERLQRLSREQESLETTHPVLDPIGVPESMHFLLHRPPGGTVAATLERLQANLAKKLCSSKLLSSASFEPSTTCVASLWRVDTMTGRLSSPVDAATSKTITNADLSSEGDDRYAVVIQLPISSSAVSEPVASPLPDGREKATCSRELRLLLDKVNPPTITRVSAFHDFDACLFNDIPIVINVKSIFSDGIQIDWYNHLGSLVCSDSAFIVPTEDHLDQQITCVISPYRSNSRHGCSSQWETGMAEAYRFKRRVARRPDNTLLRIRSSPSSRWTVPLSADGRLAQESAQLGTSFRVVSYNILADQNAFPRRAGGASFYPYCPKEVLLKGRRLPLIVHELLSYNADILCLQEVDELGFNEFLYPVMSLYGQYEGYHTNKSRRGNREGLAMFWKKTRFDLVQRESHAIKDLFPYEDSAGLEMWDASCPIRALLCAQRELRHTLATRLGQVGQIAGLRDRISRKRLWVLNTHLYYHRHASHIRVLQMVALCRQLERAIESYSHEIEAMPSADNDGRIHSDRSRIMLCGDFNSSLESAAGRILVNHEIPENFGKLKEHLNSFQWNHEDRLSAIPSSDEADFPAIRLPVTFPHVQPALKEVPSFTHYMEQFYGSLDHILIGPGLTSAGSAPMPSVRDVATHTAMPSETLPSDHVSLVCDISIN
jgi:mRNA deadenylase 3'-5' endonuclease subunit Ccr4